MRDIKFRAWDKHNRTMEWVEAVEWEAGSTAPRVKLRGRQASAPPNHYSEIMQYTGLKDKNGVEIYEGDIVRLGTLPKDDIFEVEFDQGEFQAIGKVDAHSLGFIRSWEVIGNIYENKDLLK